MKILCVKLIEFYQAAISPHKAPSCRFYPTCSEYARQAFIKRGVFWGFVLSAYRILRCNPFCRPGYDPVPEKINKVKKVNKISKSKKKMNGIY